MARYKQITAWLELAGKRYGPFRGELTEQAGSPRQTEPSSWFGTLFVGDANAAYPNLPAPDEVTITLDDGRSGAVLIGNSSISYTQLETSGTIRFLGNGELA